MNNEQMEEIKRHFGVVEEGLGHKVQLVAGGRIEIGKRDRLFSPDFRVGRWRGQAIRALHACKKK